MSPTNKPLVLAVALAGVACALSAYAVVASTAHATPPDCGVHALESRVAELERRLAEPAAVPAAPILEVAGAGESNRMPADLDARLDRLEAGLATSGTATAAVTSGDDTDDGKVDAPARSQETTRAGRPKRGTAEHLAWARQRVLDAGLTPLERSEALGEIQKHGADGFSEDVVQAMVVLGQSAEDPKVRENVWRQFDGARSPTLGVALRQALTSDAVAAVRREAAEALDGYRDDPAVRAALEHASQHDPDEKVRWEALRALRKPTK